MANKGLKPYTKQLSGSVGSISYNVNVNKNDNNLIIQIPLLQSLGINPIGIGLIYNHLEGNDIPILGEGMKTNFIIIFY